MMKGFLLFALLLLLQCTCCVHSSRHGRIDPRVDGVVSSSGFIVEPTSQNWPQRDLNLRSTSSCEETYGFMPCSLSALGNLFLMAVYGYLMFRAGSLLTDGCELVLALMGPGITGGLILPILGSFSHAAPILVSGLFGSKETAQGQVMVGMGLIAGSTVFMLTILWGACLIVGKCDLSDAPASNENDAQQFSLCGSGVSVDKRTRYMSLIMVGPVIPFIIVQFPTIIHSSWGKRIAVLVACIAATICVLSYCIYQVLHPWIQNRQIEYAKHIHVISSILNFVDKKGHGRLLRDDGKLDQEAVLRIFKTLDDDKDGYLSKRELRGLIVGLELQDPQATTDTAVDKVMAEFDSSRDDKLSKEEFTNGMSSWLCIATSTVGHSEKNSNKLMSNFHSRTREKIEALSDEIEAQENDKEKEVVEVENPFKVYVKALIRMVGGVILAGIFADPLVHAVYNFSDATSIPCFFISFIIMPLAANSGEAVSALHLMREKKKRTASLTYSEIYGAVTMNNTLCLGVFLAIVYIRGLDWEFSVEVLVILVVTLAMGLLCFFRTTFPLWMSVIAFLLYPLSLAMVYVLNHVLGWQ